MVIYFFNIAQRIIIIETTRARFDYKDKNTSHISFLKVKQLIS